MSGPPNVPKIIADNAGVWTDTSFTNTDTLYYSIQPSNAYKAGYDAKIPSKLEFKDWRVKYPNSKIFATADSPHYLEPRQGGAGTCYLMQAMAGVAEFPTVLKSIFLTATDNTPGIYALRFFIRGKPWVVAIDSYMLTYKSGWVDGAGNALGFYHAKPDAADKTVWAPLAEKAWAKIKGNYGIANGGFLLQGIRALSGLPGFGQKITKINTSANPTLAEAFTTLKAAEAAGYVMAAGTSGGGNDQEKNDCGIAKSHAYTILSAFEMTESGTTYKMLMLRNPWGITYYNKKWKHDDAAWTATLKAAVPYSIDVTTANTKGIFFMEMSQFGPQTDASLDCIGDYTIAHKRAGYKTSWLDVVAEADVNSHYTITPPAVAGDIYMTAESFPVGVIPKGT